MKMYKVVNIQKYFFYCDAAVHIFAIFYFLTTHHNLYFTHHASLYEFNLVFVNFKSLAS